MSTPWSIAMLRLRQHRLAVISAYVLALLHLLVVLADFAAPYSESVSNRQKFRHPPVGIHVLDEQGRLTRPFVYSYVLTDPLSKTYAEDPSQGRFVIRFFVRREPYRFLGIFPSSLKLFGVDPPAVAYFFGADIFGRDVLSRVLYGGRKSLFIGIIGIVIATTIGLIYGGVAGFYGGAIDTVLMRIAELVMIFPALYLLLALSAMVPANLPSSWRFFLVTLILSLIGWANLGRVIRGMVLSLRRREFVEGALAVGCSPLRVIVRHILPNTVSYVIVAATLAIPGFILGESALSFLGVGIQEPQASWGNMLQRAANVATLSEAPWLLLPGFMIFITVLCYSFLGDGLRDAFDPRAMK